MVNVTKPTGSALNGTRPEYVNQKPHGGANAWSADGPSPRTFVRGFPQRTGFSPSGSVGDAVLAGRQDASSNAASGRGLLLVRAAASDFGARHREGRQHHGGDGSPGP